jgi:phosphoribosylanthranilate isomerase
MPTLVKICGITRKRDALAAVRAGANAIGFVFAGISPRYITTARAWGVAKDLHPSIRKFGVFVDAPVQRLLQMVDEVGLDAVQLQGDEGPGVVEELKSRRPELLVAKVIKPDGRSALDGAGRFAAADLIFLDRKDPLDPASYGQAIPVSWLEGADLSKVIIAGGLNPSNVGEVVKSLRPAGVDVAGGVEEAMGKKDRFMMSAFVAAVRDADAG